MTTTQNDLERLRGLSEKAASGNGGKWELYEDTCRVCREKEASEWGIGGVNRGYHAMFAGRENAEFIVACVNYVRSLLADSALGVTERPEGCICSEAYGIGPDKCPGHLKAAIPTEAGAGLREALEKRAQAFQDRLCSEACEHNAKHIWWASIKFKEALADEFEAALRASPKSGEKASDAALMGWHSDSVQELTRQALPECGCERDKCFGPVTGYSCRSENESREKEPE